MDNFAARKAVELMSNYGLQDWVLRQASAQWKWAGRVARLQYSSWTKEVLSWATTAGRHEKRPTGEAMDRRHKFLSTQTGATMSNQDWIAWAQNASRWSNWQGAFIQQQELNDVIP